ncbi:DNA mismatch endonuclease Vsr [Bradyrhizobium sp. Arg62]|uniref:very short patch repair endonuclease n=1 Tax=Bradyrhizobium brasilense TaxID=1419277 RepID=UPI00237ABFF8|nr:very short patch repair endonuclease [Bradyrhizobium brasilense]MCC8946864.1 DNA mismatch endonuclease Vsr [Bradyrhizobium brasilense]
MDTISAIRRSANMAAIRSKHTRPEMVVRQYLFKGGLRYRLHPKQLPGKPDIVFPSRRVAVFVHGCFWHGCTKCVDGTRVVKSNSKYWVAKIEGNRLRDARNKKALRREGWKCLTVWECETLKPKKLHQLFTAIASRPALSGS